MVCGEESKRCVLLVAYVGGRQQCSAVKSLEGHRLLLTQLEEELTWDVGQS